MLNEGEAPKKKAPRKTVSSDSTPKATRSVSRKKNPVAAAKPPALAEPVAAVPRIVPPSPEPTHDEIACRAFELYLARGRQEGSAADDWLRAEHELREEKLRRGRIPGPA